MDSFAQVRPWLQVGGRMNCGITGAQVCVHINRSDAPRNDCMRCVHEQDYWLDYKDGETLSVPLLMTLDRVIDTLRERRRLTLVHCMAGVCRSPTIAAFLLSTVEHLPMLDALHVAESAIYTQQGGKVCSIVYEPKYQLIKRSASILQPL